MRSLVLDVNTIEWLPLSFLALTFLLTFASWVGMYPAGYSAYSQNAWQALFADFSTDPVSNEVFEQEENLEKHIRSNWMMLFYLLTLIASLALAAGIQILPRVVWMLPKWAEAFWPYRIIALTCLIGLGVLLLLIQLSVGFGLESALSAVIAEKLPDTSEARTPEQIQKVEITQAAVLNAFELRRTVWLSWVVLFQFLALFAVGLELLLRRRVEKPPPRVAVIW
jgi:hypothetical protein